MRLIEDALARHIAVPETPTRIVSLVPSVTELLFDLGAGGRVVGVSSFCSEPAQGLAGIARVGGQKDPDIEAIAALAPDLVIAVKEENLARDVRALEARGVAVYVAEVRTVEEALALIGELGDLVDAEPARADAIAAEVRAGVDAARRLAPSPPLPVFCPVWRDPWLAVGPNTFMGDVLRQCGARLVPVGRADARYPKVTLDDVRQARPRVILLPDEPYAFTAADAAELAPLVDGAVGAPTRSGGRGVHHVDGKLLCWYGRRTAGLARLAALLHG